ncbi:MAG: 3-phosphoshikimate 1-carboxyvinyltransferase [Rectinemataceae bacterium]
METTIRASHVGGSVRAPASKSSMQRAIACALLAEGESTLRNPSFCDDSLAALSIAEALGARMERMPQALRITGSRAFYEPGFYAADGLRKAFGGESIALDCGESGLCMRMFAPIVALLPGERILTGSGTLSRRPMHMIAAPLRALGADCRTESGFPPVWIKGILKGGFAEVDGGESSQLLTGLLTALPLARGDSTLEVRNAVSRGYLDLTLDTMRAFGVDASRDENFRRFDLAGMQRYVATNFTVEGDWSGGAFLLVAGAITGAPGSLRVEGLQTGSKQPDRAILRVLESSGARISAESDGSITVTGGGLTGFEFDATECPDLFPPLVALAAACRGMSTIMGADRLKTKESDRALALTEEFGKMGVPVRREGNRLKVQGGKISGGQVDSRGDHRIAMAAAVAGLAAETPVRIKGAECVAKSWPTFFEDLDSIAFKGA